MEYKLVAQSIYIPNIDIGEYKNFWDTKIEYFYINNKMFFSAESVIDRQDFGISWNRPFQKIAGMMVSNEVKILLNIKVKEI